MDEREELERRLIYYRALLKSTTDTQAVAAVEQLIREMCDRLSKIEKSQNRHRSGER